MASKTRRELIERRRRIVYAGLQLVSFREISLLIFVFFPLIIGIFTTLVAALMNPGAELQVTTRGILYTSTFSAVGYLIHSLVCLALPTAEELSGVSTEEQEKREPEQSDNQIERQQPPSSAEGQSTEASQTAETTPRTMASQGSSSPPLGSTGESN